MCMVIPVAVQVWRVDGIEESISRSGICCMVWGQQMYLWLRRREHALADRRACWPGFSRRSMASSSARLLIVCVGSVEVTRILREVFEGR
jgi:hypothetical protein